MSEEEKLQRRFYILDNFDWFMEEAVFYKDKYKYLKVDPIPIWDWDSGESGSIIP